MKRARTEYKRKYELVVRCLKQYLPMCRISGAGGLHLFVQFPSEYRTRELLEACKVKGVTVAHQGYLYLEPVRV